MGITSTIKLDIRTAPFFFLTILGILFYMVWGVAYSAWFDIGVYAITIILMGFGVVGIFLYSILEDE